MGRFFLWYLLARLTGSPLGSLAVLLLMWWVGDRLTFRLLPEPGRFVARWRRRWRLRRVLAVNPHDRRARFELAQLFLDARRPAEALEVLRPNIESGDDDVHTAYLWGAALARSGHREQAERALAVAREAQLGYRSGDVDLELGRMWITNGEFGRAREALERLLALRPGTVEGRYHLVRALRGLGDAEGARQVREDAWREYASLPRFHRTHERPFAWRLEPWRPAGVLAVVILSAIIAGAWLLPALLGGPP